MKITRYIVTVTDNPDSENIEIDVTIEPDGNVGIGDLMSYHDLVVHTLKETVIKKIQEIINLNNSRN